MDGLRHALQTAVPYTVAEHAKGLSRRGRVPEPGPAQAKVGMLGEPVADGRRSTAVRPALEGPCRMPGAEPERAVDVALGHTLVARRYASFTIASSIRSRIGRGSPG